MIKAIVFDLDGVLYCGDTVIDGAVDTVKSLTNSGYQTLFVTNNSGKSQQQIIEKLQRLGFYCAYSRNTYCSSHALCCYLDENGIEPIYLIGTDDLRNELSARNIRVENSSKVQAVVIGFDVSFNYGKIATALEAIVKNGAKLIVANTDPWYPAGNGRILPGCGAMVGAIVGATGHNPDFVVGKPSTYMLELICREFRFSPSDICVVGDVLDSDIQMARNFGCFSILFDPENAFSQFSGNKVSRLADIVSSLAAKKGD